jgi:hypothetical protein
MRRLLLRGIVGASFLLPAGYAVAQNSLDTLDQELNEAKQQHDDVTSQMLTTFFSKVDAAMTSPDAAIALYSDPQGANGPLPPLTPVTTENEHETVSEKEQREGQDRANLVRLATVVQLHCGLMHYAALFVLKPDQPGLQDQWVEWLKTAATIYPNINPPPDNSAPSSGSPASQSQTRIWPRPVAFSIDGIKGSPMRDSIIAKALGFTAWNDKDQGNWAVAGLPQLYKTNVLDPLRIKPTLATLNAWDVYIGLMNASEPDNDRWDDVVYPPLQFERACDAYVVDPTTERLETLVQIIKTYPANPKVDDWISRVHKLVDNYRQSHGLGPAVAQSAVPASTAPAGNPNVTVTTEHQGDMTIVTTHTNTPASNPPTGVNGQSGMRTVPIMDMQSVMSAPPATAPAAPGASPQPAAP